MFGCDRSILERSPGEIMNKKHFRIDWRLVGQVGQGIVLGGLLALALAEMATLAGDVRLFRYQKF